MKNKEKGLSNKLRNQLIDNEKELKNYLTYIRQNQHQQPKLRINQSPKLAANQRYHHTSINHQPPLNKSTEVQNYVHKYIKTLKQIVALQSYSTKKIFKKTLQFLEEYPIMSFLYEVVNTFGKDQKKLTLNENLILPYATDEMIPLFQKIIEKIQQLKRESESKKLLELGHRIQHLQTMVNTTKNYGNFNLENDQEIQKMLRKFQAERIQKYLVMEDNITKAEKRFGNFSENFTKNRQVFSNLNRVYQNIKSHDQ